MENTLDPYIFRTPALVGGVPHAVCFQQQAATVFTLLRSKNNKLYVRLQLFIYKC